MYMGINRWKKKQCGEMLAAPSQSSNLSYFFGEESQTLNTGGHFILPKSKKTNPKQGNSFFVLPNELQEVCSLDNKGCLRRVSFDSEENQSKFETVSLHSEIEKNLQ